MSYSIFDNGNLVVSFDREEPAYHALGRMAHEDPASSGGLVLVVFDTDGNVVGDSVPDAPVPHAA